jgi:acyl-CoA synthetase (AMP-forming)/AMP-acid ligase II
MNIAHHVERAAKFFPDKPAILFEGSTLTYRDLNARIDRLASALAAQRCRPRPMQGCGLTECSPFARNSRDFRHKFGSVGTPIENTEIRILDADDRELPAGRWGEICSETAAAAIVLKEGARATAEEVIAYCRSHMAAYKAPARVDFVSELPKSATGKILKRTLRDKG